MEKLTIKELAPYLPYKLQWKFEGSDDVHEVVGLDITDFGVHIISPYGDSGRCSVKDGKPILRPLSQLTQQIEHNGERFVPLDELTEGETVSMSLNDYAEDWDSRTHYCFKRYVEEWVKGDIHHLDFLPYGFIEKLQEWHFDVFGLIDVGLALPIDGKEVESITCGYCDCEFEKGTGGNYGEYGEVCINCYIGLS